MFAHLPLLLNEDGTKLSKRQQNITVENYRNDGIFPLALINFVVSCGSYSKKQIISLQSMEELIQSVSTIKLFFDYSLFSRIERVKWMRALLLKFLPQPSTLSLLLPNPLPAICVCVRTRVCL